MENKSRTLRISFTSSKSGLQLTEMRVKILVLSVKLGAVVGLAPGIAGSALMIVDLPKIRVDN
jgi:hypothetical protein